MSGDRRTGEQSRLWRVHITPGKGFVDWHRPYALPRRFKATVEGDSLPYIVHLEMSAGEHGVEGNAVHYERREGGPPITSRGVRSLPLGEVIQTAVAAAAWEKREGPGSITYVPGGDPDLTDRFEVAAPASLRPGQRVTDEHLQRVAKVYEAALETPTRAVQEHREWAPISYSTAARWVGEARRRGLLAKPPERGKGRP